MCSHSHQGDTNITGNAGIQQASQQERQEEAELTLKRLLKDHFGSTKHPAVKKGIDSLIPLNPTPQPTKSPLLQGDFICHTLPEFPGRVKTAPPNVVQYTLGKLSFGIFQPRHLVCTIRAVRQSIRVRNTTKSGKFQTYEYPVMMDLTIHTQTDGTTVDLPAIVSHDAVCYECPRQPHRLKVSFKGSTLMPANEVVRDVQLMQVWTETFAGAYAKAKKESNIFSKTLQGMLAWWFQMTLPTDEEFESSQNHSVHFEIKRAPRGHLDVLYLSDTTRITKGNRGTLVIVEPDHNFGTHNRHVEDHSNNDNNTNQNHHASDQDTSIEMTPQAASAPPLATES